MTKVLIAGLGNMGLSHALAHHHPPGRADCWVGEPIRSRGSSDDLSIYPAYSDFHTALAETKPDLVVVATYSDSHADFACAAMEAGAHVFVEKPLATTVADAKRIVEKAIETNRKLVIGYILRHHPSWMRLIDPRRATWAGLTFSG